MENNIFAKENYKPNQKHLPPFITLYGEIGIGKSTFCSTFPNPFFFDFEDRTLNIENITRDSDFNLDIANLKNWDHLLQVVRSLKDTEYKTIVFDGVSKLQSFLWASVARKLNVPDARDLAFGKGYGIAYTEFEKLIVEAKNLQRNYKKTIIFVDHEKVKEEDQLTPNMQTFGKFLPECMNGIFKILLKESDYIFRIVEDIFLKEDFKTKETKATFKGLVILTDRKVNPESFLKSSLSLPSSIIATYGAFKAEYEKAYRKLFPKIEEVVNNIKDVA